MATSTRNRRREAGGRWPVPKTAPQKTKPAEEPMKRVAKAGGLERRATRNTRRGAAGGSARSTRGRKGVIHRTEKGGVYGNPQRQAKAFVF